MPVKPSLETQGEKSGHKGVDKVASSLADTSLTVSAHSWGTGASALGSS